MTPEIRLRARNKGPLSPRGGGPSHRSDSLLTKRAGRESPRDANGVDNVLKEIYAVAGR